MNKGISEIHPTGLRDLGGNYINAFVTFIDILGFTELISSNSSEEVNHKLDAMKYFNDVPQRRRVVYQSDELRPMVYQFSDSIIRIQPVPSEFSDKDDLHIEDFLAGEVESLLIAQGNLACNGVFVRGGITFGEVCVNKSRVFGPAFIRAYKLESVISKYPRILIDQRLCCDRNNLMSKFFIGDHWHKSKDLFFELLQRDTDGQYYIQYLTHLYESARASSLDAKKVLIAHRDNVQYQLDKARMSNSEDVSGKYFWVANYHNKIIDRSFSKLDYKFHEVTGESLHIDVD